MRLQSLIFILASILFMACNNQSNQKESNKEAQQKASPQIPSEDTPQQPTDFSNMVRFDAGSYLIGSENGLPNEKPVHEVKLNAFYIDQSPVTVADFREFINATGYQTEADKFGDSGVFNFSTSQWELKKGANWEYPFGRDGEQAIDDHPVTHVSWNDGQAYAKWAGKRLPTEAEWEVAARSGTNNDERFSWGKEVVVDGNYQANVWQGNSVANNSNEDGYRYTSPVGAFGTNEAGLSDMGGNVWNWCEDTYRPYPGNQEPFQVNDNVKVIRGGSFFFDQNGEDSFTVSGRSFNTHETSLFNTGFRCAADAP